MKEYINGEVFELSQEELNRQLEKAILWEAEVLVARKKSLRERRNKLLQDSDWFDNLDSPLTIEQQALWKVYRQELRDLPKNTEDFLNPVWPVKPT